MSNASIYEGIDDGFDDEETEVEVEDYEIEEDDNVELFRELDDYIFENKTKFDKIDLEEIKWFLNKWNDVIGGL